MVISFLPGFEIINRRCRSFVGGFVVYAVMRIAPCLRDAGAGTLQRRIGISQDTTLDCQTAPNPRWSPHPGRRHQWTNI